MNIVAVAETAVPALDKIPEMDVDLVLVRNHADEILERIQRVLQAGINVCAEL